MNNKYCKKCGGQLLDRDEDGNLCCLQCGTPHDENGELIKPITGEVNTRSKPHHYYKGKVS
jgi:uncharacterized membrane protein YvbJ